MYGHSTIIGYCLYCHLLLYYSYITIKVILFFKSWQGARRAPNVLVSLMTTVTRMRWTSAVQAASQKFPLYVWSGRQNTRKVACMGLVRVQLIKPEGTPLPDSAKRGSIIQSNA